MLFSQQQQPSITDEDWLQEWTQLTRLSPPLPQVPQEACMIVTPLNSSSWRTMLLSYPHRATADFLQGLNSCFRIGCTSNPSEPGVTCNLLHPEVVSNYLMKEIRKGCVIGPFPKGSVSPPAHISCLGVIPKSSQPDKWRLIIDLSHPCKRSVNDGIPKHLCSMSYIITIDNAIERILAHGPGTMLAKIDIRSAFRLMPVHPADRHLLAMKWEGQVYITHVSHLASGQRQKLFNPLADLLHWIQGPPSGSLWRALT